MKKLIGINDEGHRVGQDHHRAQYTDREVEIVRRFKEQGMTYPQIAEKMEMPYWTVSRLCRHERRAQAPTDFKDPGRLGRKHFVRCEHAVTEKVVSAMVEQFNRGGVTASEIARALSVGELVVRRHVLKGISCNQTEEETLNALKIFNTLPDDALIASSTFAALLDVTVQVVNARSRNVIGFPSPVKQIGLGYRYRVADVRRFLSEVESVAVPSRQPRQQRPKQRSVFRRRRVFVSPGQGALFD